MYMCEVVIWYDKPMIRYDVKFTVPGIENDMIAGWAHCLECLKTMCFVPKPNYFPAWNLIG